MSVDCFDKFLLSWMKILPNNGEFEIIWHGGEPLLRGIDFYKQVVEITFKHSDNKRNFSHCLQTNGTLINEGWAKFFKENNFKVGLSIDGPLESHNFYRKDKNDKIILKKIKDNVLILQEHSVSFGQVVVVHSGNVDCPQEIFDFSKKLGVTKIQISPCFEIEENKALPFSIHPEQFGIFICKLYDIWLKEDNPKISIGYIDDIVESFLGYDCFNCLLSDRCNNFLVIDWDGNVKPCEELFGNKIIFGNINEKSIEEITASSLYSNFYSRISQRRKDVCGNCGWFEICKGGCPHHWPSFHAGKTVLCEANKIIFGHIGESIKNIYSKGS